MSLGSYSRTLARQDIAKNTFDRALMQFTAASIELEQSGQIRVLASVQNNLSLLFTQLERFEEAHEHLDRALSVVTKLNDKGSQAQFEDSRARVFLK